MFAPQQKEKGKPSFISSHGNAVTNPLQLQAAEEEPLQMKQNPLQLQAAEEEEPLQMKQNPLQLKGAEEEEPLQMKQNPLQLQGAEEEEPLQMKQNPLQLQGAEEEEPLQMKQNSALPSIENKTGLPDNLKAGVESLSGYSMDDVNVHYNSEKPAQLQALAYAQGTDIHIGPGQEKHLPHEAWHVAQQKQGRVQPTMQMKGKVNVNDDKGLEKEADVMGTKALQRQSIESNKSMKKQLDAGSIAQRQSIIQRGGAKAPKDAEENLQGTGRGLEGIQGLINGLTPNNVNPACYVGVMVRYPTWGNYIKAKGGHAAIQIQVDFGEHGGIKYLQAGVSATGSIQVEPIFHTMKTKEGYNIKQLTKSVDKGSCINVLMGIAKEIAIAQPYQERIAINTGSATNCSLWAAKMAAIAGMNLSTFKMWVYPSPNDLQHALDYYRNKGGYTLTDEKALKAGAQEIDVNVGTVPAPQFDDEGGISNNLSTENVNVLKLWAANLN
jgi:hypothetical protein